MASPVVRRITLFKLPEAADVDAALAKYATLKDDAKKGAQPYILAASASRVYDDPRCQGFTICAETSFASLDDMKYYDDECAAHGAIKALIKPKLQGPPLIIYMDEK
ncbi:hypothetical protein BDY21DRAFT_280477 [Lineolata rhizophorae]|uniref:Stress-response A/B barrel domain-containing protein n=1 Tax=Lineolata rhizophorae TaxID=578093 RepID=A0A6A6PA16_9PEZI|nr:hypothetical protein BDY21DRAFT_280477 [Lineolata rhizophorae]